MKLLLTGEMANAAAELRDAFPCYAVAITFHYDGTPRFVLTARGGTDVRPWWCLISADPDEIKQALASGEAVAS